MNSIQNYGITNYQVRFKAKKIDERAIAGFTETITDYEHLINRYKGELNKQLPTSAKRTFEDLVRVYEGVVNDLRLNVHVLKLGYTLDEVDKMSVVEKLRNLANSSGISVSAQQNAAIEKLNLGKASQDETIKSVLDLMA